MKKLSVIFIVTFLLGLAVSAWAAGQLVKDKSKSFVPIQNIIGVSPTPDGTACTTKTGTKGTIVTVPVSGYIGMKWTATDAAGAAVVVKRYVNYSSGARYIPESSGSLAINSAMTNVHFKLFSSNTVKTHTVCRELQ